MKKRRKKKNSLENFIKSLVVCILVVAGLLSLVKETAFKNPLVLTASSFASTAKEPLILSDLESSASSSAEVVKTDNFSVRVPILMYHHIQDGISPLDQVSYALSVTPVSLEEQFSFLASNGYQTLSLNDLYDSLENHTPLPAKSVVITFDDGYRDFYSSAFPLLQKYNLRAVSFYIADYTSYPDYMTWDMLKQIYASGLVDIESHTLSHPMLTSLSIPEEVNEIFESKKILEEGLGKKVNFFAYPYGDYNETVVNIVKSAGYKLAFSTRVGTRESSAEKFFLRRVPIVGSDTLDTFKNKVINE